MPDNFSDSSQCNPNCQKKKKNEIKQPEKKKQKIKQIKVTAIKAIPTVDPKIAWKKSEKEETTFLAEYALY